MLSSLKMMSMSPCTVLKGRFPTYAVNGGSVGSSFCFLEPPEPPPPPRGLEGGGTEGIMGMYRYLDSDLCSRCSCSSMDFMQVNRLHPAGALLRHRRCTQRRSFFSHRKHHSLITGNILLSVRDTRHRPPLKTVFNSVHVATLCIVLYLPYTCLDCWSNENHERFTTVK